MALYLDFIIYVFRETPELHCAQTLVMPSDLHVQVHPQGFSCLSARIPKALVHPRDYMQLVVTFV